MAQPADSSQRQDSALTPLYARLPRGPHHMERGEVAENQRRRMHGAMVEAVAAQGYGGTSVRQVISLAGVSRRSFYEQFANKQECFLSTLELLAARAGEQTDAAYRTGGPDIEQRMDAGLRALLELVAANPKCVHMALVDAPAAGPAGWSVLTRTLLGFERTLFESFARTPGASTLPAGVVRGIAGGIHMMVLKRVCEQRTSELPGLADEVRSWTLAAHSPAAASVPYPSSRTRSDESRPVIRRRGPEQREEPALGLTRTIGTAVGGELAVERARILRSALDTIALEGYGNLSPLRIVDRAGVSIDTFFDLFGDMEDCVSVALANLSEELRETLAWVDRQAPQPWPVRVKRALRSLMGHLAAFPSHAGVIATGAFEMGPTGIGLSLELADEVARDLIAGAPDDRQASGCALAVEGVAGAVWHTVYCHVVHNTTEMLPSSADQLAYLVLAPFVGAERAAEAVGEDAVAYEARSSDLTRREAMRPVTAATP